jgi:hypothetical protein
VAGDVLCLSLLEFAQSSQLALELTYRDINVVRSGNGDITRFEFGKSYSSDLGTASYETKLFVVGSAALKGSGITLRSARVISNDNSQAAIILIRLPKEGTGGVAREDFAKLSRIVSQISSSTKTVPARCTG